MTPIVSTHHVNSWNALEDNEKSESFMLSFIRFFGQSQSDFRNVIFTFCTLVSNLYTSSFFDRLGSWRVRDLLRNRVFRDLLRNFFREFPDASPNVVYIFNFLLNFQTFFFFNFDLLRAKNCDFLNFFELLWIFKLFFFLNFNRGRLSLEIEKHFHSCFY